MKWKGPCTPVSVRVDHTYVFPFCLTVGDQYKSKGYINSWIHNGIWNLNVGSWWGEYTIQFIQLSLSVKSSSAWNVGHWSTLNLEANTVTKISSYFDNFFSQGYSKGPWALGNTTILKTEYIVKLSRRDFII